MTWGIENHRWVVGAAMINDAPRSCFPLTAFTNACRKGDHWYKLYSLMGGRLLPLIHKLRPFENKKKCGLWRLQNCDLERISWTQSSTAYINTRQWLNWHHYSVDFVNFMIIWKIICSLGVADAAVDWGGGFHNSSFPFLEQSGWK